MSEAKRRKIAQLRALAASTTFPEEAKSARAKADAMEAALPTEQAAAQGAARNLSFEELMGFAASGSSFLHDEFARAMMQEAINRMMRDGL